MAAKKSDRTPSKLSSKRATAGKASETFTAEERAAMRDHVMPAYAKDGSILCFFQDARKFKTRYCTLGFTDKATLDDGAMWPVTFALKELTPAIETRIIELLKRAIR